MINRLMNWKQALTPPAAPTGGGAPAQPTAGAAPAATDAFTPSAELAAVREAAAQAQVAAAATGMGDPNGGTGATATADAALSPWASTPEAPKLDGLTPWGSAGEAPKVEGLTPWSSTPAAVDTKDMTPWAASGESPKVEGLTPWGSEPSAVDTTGMTPWTGNKPTNVAPTPAVGATSGKGAAPYINQYHPTGEANGYTNGPSNCGPTSAAMIARAFGYGANLTDAQLINHLGGIGGTTEAGTSVNGIAAMARAMGKGAETRGPGANVAWIAEQLQAGKMVVANGDYYAMADHNRAKIGQGGHYVAVIGMDSNGNFLVNDPADASIKGRAFTPDELATFIKSNSNGGYQTAIG